MPCRFIFVYWVHRTKSNMNLMTDHNYCLILAGGKGRRLWPCSRESFPKQFIDFFGTGRTQLQQTYDRMAAIMPEDHIFINTNISYLDLVKEQLPDVSDDHIMAEPVCRGTAPSIAWGGHRIAKFDSQAALIAVPTDQMVINDEAFRRNVLDGLAFVREHDCFLTMGITPTRAEPGYGYIQTNSHVGGNIYKVKTFTEKPDRDFARMFMESGEFVWNTGLFLSNVSYLRESFSRFLPEVLRRFDSEEANALPGQEERYMREYFSVYPNLSIESGVLEKTDMTCVMKCDFGWADLGTWHSIYEALPKTNDDNVVIDSDVMMEDSHHNVIKIPRGRLAVINGLEGYIVAEEGNVLLICKKEDSSALIRKYVSEVQLKKGDAYV